MPDIYLLRHCEYNNPRGIIPGRLPVELSEKGKAKAAELQKFFADKNIDKIYSSAVLRCKQTAEIVSNGKIPVTFDQRILETFSAYQGYWGENWHGSGYHFFSHHPELGGETLEDIQDRMVNFWNEITANLQGNIIICSHGDPLFVLRCSLESRPFQIFSEKESEIPGYLQKGEFLRIQK